MANPDAIAAAVARCREFISSTHLRDRNSFLIDVRQATALCDAAERCAQAERDLGREQSACAAAMSAQVVAERERDEARAECAELREELKQRNKSDAKCCAEERRALQVRITALTEALRPFADLLERGYTEQGFMRRYCDAARAALAGEVGK